MKQRQGSCTTPTTSREQFHTPRRRNSQELPATVNVIKRNRSPESTLGSSRKRTSLPRAQSTLTQIDFVTQHTAPDDEGLDYIEDCRGNTLISQNPDLNDGPGNDSDYLPTPAVRSARPARITRLKMNERERGSSERTQKVKNSGSGDRDADQGHKLRKSQTPRSSLRSKSGRKSVEKSTAKRDKTLTQMDFVRRYITIDDDDEVNMGYIQTTPHKENTKIEEETPLPKQPQPTKHATSAKRQPRVFEEELDLSTGDPISQPNAVQERDLGIENESRLASIGPSTPHKSRMREIPSSQTPESPGLAIITSSQFRGETRSPSKKESWKPASHSIPLLKEESPQTRRVADVLPNSGNRSLLRPETIDQNMHDSLDIPPARSHSQEIPRGGIQSPSNEIVKKERTVVYETDADSDYEEYEENLNRDTATPTPKKTTQLARQQVSSQVTRTASESPKDDSQELPLPGISSSPNLDDAPPSEPPMSDASVYYQRMHAATQFPHEPIPTLNTQKMAELFPQGDSSQIQKPGPIKPTQDQVPGSFSQIHPPSQGEKDPTEMVPESSPIRGGENEATCQRSRAPKSVVQVESSQAVDQNFQWKGHVLSRSQILTSSIMESVPMPNFWMGSQDSVGEPYSLPEE